MLRTMYAVKRDGEVIGGHYYQSIFEAFEISSTAGKNDRESGAADHVYSETTVLVFAWELPKWIASWLNPK